MYLIAVYKIVNIPKRHCKDELFIFKYIFFNHFKISHIMYTHNGI